MPIDQKIITNEKTGKEEMRTIYKTLGYYADKPSALAALADYNRGIVVAKKDITLGEVYKEWSDIKFTYLSKQTVDNYRAGWMHLS